MMPGLTGWDGFKLGLTVMVAFAVESVVRSPFKWLVAGAVVLVAWGILT